MTEILTAPIFVAAAFLIGRHRGTRTERARYERGYQKAKEAMTNAAENVSDLGDDAVTERLASTPDAAICDGTAQSRKALAGALLDDAGPDAQRAGLVLIEQIEAAC